MSFGSPSSPAAPDPAVTAAAQTQMNEATARTQATLNRVNQVGPDGTITYSQAPGKTSLNQSEYDKAKERMLATRPQYDADGNYAPPSLSAEEDAALRGEFSKYTPSDQWTMQTQLSPDNQKLYDLSKQAQIGYGEAANSQIQTVKGALGQPFTGQPYQDIQSGALAGTAQAFDRASQAAATPFSDPGAAASIQALGYGGDAAQRTAALAGQPINTDYGAIRQQSIDAANSRLQPQFQQQEDQLRTRLLNSGISEGSEAWNRAYTQMNQSQNDSRQQTLLNAEALTGQAINQTGALRGIPLNELAQQQGIAAGYGQQAGAALGQAAQARQVPLNEAGLIGNLSGAFGNQAAQGLQSALAIRGQPLNEASALLTGQQVGVPQMQQVPGTQVAPTDYGGMIQNSYAGQLADANRKAQTNAANTGAIAGGVGAIGSVAVAAIL